MVEVVSIYFAFIFMMVAIYTAKDIIIALFIVNMCALGSLSIWVPVKNMLLQRII